MNHSELTRLLRFFSELTFVGILTVLAVTASYVMSFFLKP